MLILEEIQYLIEASKPSVDYKQIFTNGLKSNNLTPIVRAIPRTRMNIDNLFKTKLRAPIPNTAAAAALNNDPPAAAARGKIGDIIDKIKSSKTAKYGLGGAASIGVGGYVYNKYQNAKENAKVAEAPFNIADHKGKIAGGIAATGTGAYLLNKRQNR